MLPNSKVESNLRDSLNYKRPNIVLILADDMGWGDVGYNGRKDAVSPNIDVLASQGVIFTQGYVSASVCGPSRAGILTGTYQQRFGCGENPSMTGYPDNMKYPKAGVPTSQLLISEYLKLKKYQTAMFGKWHLGMHSSLVPNARGFDEFYGFLNGSHDYYEAYPKFPKKKDKWPLFENTQMVENYNNEYFTELFSRKAVDFINKSAKNKDPFFVYVAYNAVHHPWQVPEKYINRVKHVSNSKDKQVFAAMCLAMDDGVGTILNSLKENNIEENTIVIFVSDNGSPRGQGLKPSHKDSSKKYADHLMSSPGPFRGFKGDTFEGGIRVPFVMKWPSHIPSGLAFNHPVSTIDVMPTILSYLKINQAVKGGIPFDGVDLLPYLNGDKKNEIPHETLYWRRDDDYAIRKGDWKLTFNNHSVGLLPERKKGTKKTIENAGKRELFFLLDDKEERFDLSEKYPEKVLELQHEFDLWDTNLPDNEWWGGSFNRKKKYK